MSSVEQELNVGSSAEIIDIDSLAFVSNSFYDRLPNFVPTAPEEAPTVQYLHHRRSSDSHGQKRPSTQQEEGAKKTKRTSFNHQPSPRRFSLRDQLSNLRYNIRRSVDYAISLGGFRQQRLPSYEPIINCLLVGRFMLMMSLILVPLGIALFALKATPEIKFSYGDECKNARDYVRLTKKSCIFCGGGKLPCKIDVLVPEDLKIPIFLYYELSNFYHNHRHLVKSIDGDQFRGQIFAKDGKPLAPAHSCAPFSLDENGMYYFPCGALANSMFTDRFALQTETGYDVQLKEKGIAVSYSTPYKFSNPRDVTPANYYYERAFYKAFIMPKDWNKEIWDEWWKSGGMENERWQNWMLPSSKPTFRKLYAIIDSAPHGCTDGTLCKGNYIMHIDYRYDVTGVGNKAFILTTTSFMGASNRFIPLFTSGLGLFYALCGFQLLRIVDFRNHFHQQDHHSITAEQKPDEVKEHTTSKFQDEIPNKHAPEKIRQSSNTNIGFKITSPTPPDVSRSSSSSSSMLSAVESLQAFEEHPRTTAATETENDRANRSDSRNYGTSLSQTSISDNDNGPDI